MQLISSAEGRTGLANAGNSHSGKACVEGKEEVKPCSPKSNFIPPYKAKLATNIQQHNKT